MSLTLKHIPEYHVPDGPSMLRRGYQLAPGTSDYVAGGYVVKASDVGMTFLYGAVVIAQNSVADSYFMEFDLASAAFTGTDPLPQTQIKCPVKIPVISGSGLMVEVAVGTNLTGAFWWVEFRGY